MVVERLSVEAALEASLEHRLALARCAQRLASAQALTTEIDNWPAPAETLW